MPELTDPHIEQATAAAGSARAELGLPPGGPVESDLLALAEGGLGLAVALAPLPEKIAGVYVRKRGRFLVLVRATDYPTRQRFTLAHEIGHHRMGHVGRIDVEADVFGSPADKQEQQANFFASEFLMPIESVREWLAGNCRGGPNPDVGIREVVRLADAFHVSPPAALYRLSSGRFGIGGSELTALWNDVKAQRHVKIAENLGIGPGDDEIARHWAAAAEGAGQARLPAGFTGDADAMIERLAELAG